MKANELMIGDWVLYDNQPHQIRQLGIFGENRDGEDYPAVCVGKPNGIGLILERNEIKPIPLTPEILEKNGFYYDEDRKAYLMGVIFRVKPERYGLFSFEICGCPYPLNTVHELQHALRLCGIEKEIVL